jgi:DNA-binding NtrC family response regulator
MPGMTGIELIKKIKEREDIVEFIIITGYASIDTAVEAVRVGAFDYVVKPFKFDELKIVIKNAKDKVNLKKTNEDLVKKLHDLHREIDTYSKAKQKTSNS